jgi:hypothetical protein
LKESSSVGFNISGGEVVALKELAVEEGAFARGYDWSEDAILLCPGVNKVRVEKLFGFDFAFPSISLEQV